MNIRYDEDDDNDDNAHVNAKGYYIYEGFW